MTPSTELQLMTPSQVAETLCIPPRTLEKWREDPEHPLPYAHVGRHVRYRVTDVAAFIEQRFAEAAI